ncbi:aldehyde dehydrogenase family protein, partial [Streptomyces tendae]
MRHRLSELSEPSGKLPDELRILNPATEEVVATVPAASAADVDAAVARAARAQATWAALAPGD